jgi:hypothetical protein
MTTAFIKYSSAKHMITSTRTCILCFYYDIIGGRGQWLLMVVYGRWFAKMLTAATQQH